MRPPRCAQDARKEHGNPLDSVWVRQSAQSAQGCFVVIANVPSLYLGQGFAMTSRGGSMKKALVASVLLAAFMTTAHAQTEFYKGKTVTVLIGARLTGSLSIGAQIVSRHLGNHIPGNPTVVIKP